MSERPVLKRFIAIKGSRKLNVVKGKTYRLERHNFGTVLATKWGKQGVTYLLNPHQIIQMGILEEIPLEETTDE